MAHLQTAIYFSEVQMIYLLMSNSMCSENFMVYFILPFRFYLSLSSMLVGLDCQGGHDERTVCVLYIMYIHFNLYLF